MRRWMLCTLACTACVSPDIDLSSTSQAEEDWDGGPEDPSGETIVIEGDADPC